MYINQTKLVLWLLAVILTCACTQKTRDIAHARHALYAFLNELSEGNYAQAAQLYCGSYESLISFNPELDPGIGHTLLQSACQKNGFQCLATRTITFMEYKVTGEYIFTVNFNRTDGGLFIRDSCCGEVPRNSHQSEFHYRVIRTGDGRFCVIDLPVYVP